MAYVIIVELRAKPDCVAEFAEPIDRHAHNSRPLEEGCLALDVRQDPADPPASSATSPTVTRRHTARHLETDSVKRFWATAPDLVVPGSQSRPAPPSPSAATPTVSLRVA
jgi:quinol monooxygenase YgiN